MIPLVIRFPNGEYVGRVSQNVQTLDVAPTILDYLGFDIPKWMEGRSLISKPIAEERKIFIAQCGPNFPIRSWKWVSSSTPPYYTLGGVSIVYRNNYCRYNLNDNTISCKKLSNDVKSLISKELTITNTINIISDSLSLYGYPKIK